MNNNQYPRQHNKNFLSRDFYTNSYLQDLKKEYTLKKTKNFKYYPKPRTLPTSDNKYMGKSIIKNKCHQNYEYMTLQGTCQTLEKKYMRLTAPPNPKLVRPLHILQIHFSNILTKLQIIRTSEKNNNIQKTSTNKTQNTSINNRSFENTFSSCQTYNYICSQLQAIRQDLTVQRIANPFTIHVYETHARIALQHHDWNQFNQCQTRLMDLYELLPSTNQEEFISFRMVYYLLLRMTNNTSQYDSGLMDIQSLLQSLTKDQRLNKYIKKSQEIVISVMTENYHLFFKIYRNCFNEDINYLLEALVPQVRYNALKIIVKAYVPSIDISYILGELGINDISMGKKWLMNCGCILNDIKTNILKKGTILSENIVYLDETNKKRESYLDLLL